MKALLFPGPGSQEIGMGGALFDDLQLPSKDNQVEEPAGRDNSAKQFEEAKNNKRQGITAISLGSALFKNQYGLKYAYLTGSMVRGISSKQLVIAVGKAGMLGHYGTGGLGIDEIESAIKEIKAALGDIPFGVNLLHQPMYPEKEDEQTAVYLKHNVKYIEAAAFMAITPALVLYRLLGLTSAGADGVICSNKIMGKISRPEVAQVFLSPAPEKIVKQLLKDGKITQEQARLSSKVPMADAICVEADSGGHTDMGVTSTLMPAILRQRDEMKKEHGYPNHVFVGAAGGIGTPEAAAAAFILGADFILTGSINQCTVEAGTSDMAKDLLQQMCVQDTDYAPAGDMFEMGARVQVLKKGLFFPARANKLYDLYRYNASIEDIDEKTRRQIQKTYFNREFDDIYEEAKDYYAGYNDSKVQMAEKSPKFKMAMIFKWYFAKTLKDALRGNADNKVNFQIHTGPALGAFNQWVKGTEMESWKNRHADEIGIKLMTATAAMLNERIEQMHQAMTCD